MKRKFISFILSAIIATSVVYPSVANAATVNTSNSDLVVNSTISKSLPSKYDSRDLNYISGVKNQGEIGSCWTFSTMGALETAIKKNSGQSKDFSEIHLAVNNGFLGANDGGNGIMAASYFASWQGPVSETDAPYPNPAVPSNVKSRYNGTVTNHIQDIIFVDKSKTGQAKIDAVKKNVYKYGASTVQVSIKSIDPYSGTIFNYNGNAIDHEILIVGWDDNYSRDNFDYIKPNHNGAFICRNSWGDELGDNGYFYLSYEDQNLLDSKNTLISFDKVESTNNYKDVYAGCLNTSMFQPPTYYQDGISELLPLEMNSINGTGIGQNEKISAVGVISLISNVDCELYYTDSDVNTRDISNAIKPEYKVKKFHIDEAGFHTIKLDNPIVPKDRKNFSFWFRMFYPSNSSLSSSPTGTFAKKHYEFLFPESASKNPNNIAKSANSPASILAGRFYTNEISSSNIGWTLRDNVWYYYNQNGTLTTGWTKIDGSWYYFNNDGKMQTGWTYVNGTWYYLNSNGTMKTGWLNQNGTWYFLDNSGAMRTGWTNINGTWYFMGNSGSMTTGWINLNGTWYYLNNSGSMKTGWLQSSGSWYYLNSNGSMATNAVVDGWSLDSYGIGKKL